MFNTPINIIFILVLFLGGIYACIYWKPQREGLTTMDGDTRCPNLLIQKDLNIICITQNSRKCLE